MSLDIYLMSSEGDSLWSANITHNLGRMARECGLYSYMWEANTWKGKALIPNLEVGLRELVCNKTKYEQFNPINGWGDWLGLVRAAAQFLQACRDYPEATVETCR